MDGKFYMLNFIYMAKIFTFVVFLIAAYNRMVAIVLEKEKPAKRKFIGGRSPDSVPDNLSSAADNKPLTPAKKSGKDKGKVSD